MPEKEFNLIDEAWVQLMKPDGRIEEASLADALLRAHEFADLGGETQTQNIAVLRLLLAVLHTVFSRVDENGEDAPLADGDADTALERWEALWESGRFPEKPITDYFAQWHERFWLFHPERPFMQALSAQEGTKCTAAKLIGELSESGNKARLFQTRAGEGKKSLSYAEAARWLLYLNGFDDAALKPHIPKEKRQNTISLGWLGRLGLIYAKGKNLYETLMLNLVLLNDEEPWGNPLPDWEREQPRETELRMIAMPDNQAALLTMRSRLIWLNREQGVVTGYGILCGDAFQNSNDAFCEQMTVWRQEPEKKGQASYYYPRTHIAARQMWRDFANMFITSERKGVPGVVRWVQTLQETGVLQRKEYIQFAITGNRYDSAQKSAVTDSIGDSLTLHTALFSQMNEGWRRRIAEEIQKCDNAAGAVGNLAGDIYLAGGGDTETVSTVRRQTGEQWYAQLNQPFRRWLLSISPETDAVDEKISEWHRTAREKALLLGRTLVEQAGDKALFGRTIELKSGSKTKKQHYSAPEAYLWFRAKIYKEYPKEGEA